MSKLKPNQFILDGYLITERPLLYQTEMVKAVLEGRKNRTRRTKGLDLVNLPLTPDFFQYQGTRVVKKMGECHDFFAPEGDLIGGIEDKHIFVKSPYGKAGDLLWVRETMIRNNNSQTYWPVADGYVKTSGYEKTVSSIHMPKTAARIWLMVEEIRCERLQDISEEDAIAEGIKIIDPEAFKYDDSIGSFQSALSAFRALWREINGEDSWKANPWVWVVKFRVLSKTGKPSDQVILENYKEVTGKEVHHG